MACCFERPGKASETYPQRLDDVLLAFFLGASGYLVASGARSRPPQWK
jgi:hypothetical protein